MLPVHIESAWHRGRKWKVGVIKVFINGIVSNILPKKILKSTIPVVTKWTYSEFVFYEEFIILFILQLQWSWDVESFSKGVSNACGYCCVWAGLAVCLLFFSLLSNISETNKPFISMKMREGEEWSSPDSLKGTFSRNKNFCSLS